MARINHRASVRAGNTKRRPSKRCRQGSMKFWRAKALKAAKASDEKLELREQLTKVEGEKRELEEQLVAVRGELQRERRGIGSCGKGRNKKKMR